MTTPTEKVTSTSNDNNILDIESGGGTGSSGILTGTPPLQTHDRTPLLLSSNDDTITTANHNNNNETANTTSSNDNVTKDTSTKIEGSSTSATTTTTTATAAEAIPASSLQQTAMSGFAGLGFVSSLISMMAEYSTTAIQHPAIVVSGCLGLILSPYAKFQQEKLTQVKALEQTNSVLEEELKYLQQQHEEVKKHVQAVNTSTTKLLSLQSALSTMQSANIQSIDQLEQQVQQAKDLLSQFEQNTQALILQNLITVLVNCDRDHTLTLDDNEIDTLIKSLESINNVQFNDAKVRQVIVDNQRSVTAIMEIARNLIANTTNRTTAVGTDTGTTKPMTTSTGTSTTTTTTQPPGIALENDTIFSFIES